MKNSGLAISKDEVYIGPEHAGELFGWVNTSQNAVYRSVVLSYAQIGEDGARMSLMGPSSGEQAEPIDEGFHNALSLELTESRRNGHDGRPCGAVMDSVIQTCSPNKSNLLSTPERFGLRALERYGESHHPAHRYVPSVYFGAMALGADRLMATTHQQLNDVKASNWLRDSLYHKVAFHAHPDAMFVVPSMHTQTIVELSRMAAVHSVLLDTLRLSNSIADIVTQPPHQWPSGIADRFTDSRVHMVQLAEKRQALLKQSSLSLEVALAGLIKRRNPSTFHTQLEYSDIYHNDYAVVAENRVRNAFFERPRDLRLVDEIVDERDSIQRRLSVTAFILDRLGRLAKLEDMSQTRQ